MGRAERGAQSAVWRWSAAAAAAVLAASAWVRSPSVLYLSLGILATAAAFFFAGRAPARAGSLWATNVALVIAAGLAIPAQIDLGRVATSWSAWETAAVVRADSALRKELNRAIVEAQAADDAALRHLTDRNQTFAAIQDYVPSSYDRGVVVFNGDSLVAWSGVLRVSADGAQPGIESVITPLYTAIRVTKADGGRRATAVVLVDANPPADSVSKPLAREIARAAGVRDFELLSVAPQSTAPFDYVVAGRHLFNVSVIPSTQDEVTFAVRERARIVVSAFLAIALLAFIVAVWRHTPSLRTRIGVVLLALVCTAIVPVNQYSNVSRLFTPAIYYAPIGRQLTANAGALTITTALALLALIALVRAQHRPSARSWATATVVLVAVLGPFLLRALADGIQFPPRGADFALWLMWEVPLFLAGVVVLLAGATAGSSVLGQKRGAPPVLAPTLAGAAALIGPMVWQAPGQWPGWYTYLWIGTIAALALSRRSRYLVASASLVAALGAVTLVWGRSARGRVSLAEADLASLSVENQSAFPLLQRFGDVVALDSAPTTRLDLLTRYAGSNLASASYPVSLSVWPARASKPSASFSTTALALQPPSLGALVAQARRDGHLVIESVPGDTTMLAVLAAPARDGGVVTVAVAPRSRLFSADPYVPLLGLEPEATTEPPYTVQLRERMSEPDSGARWRREVNELHGDWDVKTAGSVWRAHVEVDLRPLPVLIQRGVLIVVLDLVIVGLLWTVGAMADGSAGRWLRLRRREWWRSYRARLSFALFLFFVVPASVFAVWSYQQLANDARQARELLVTETLRAVSPSTRSDWLTEEGTRLGTPLMLFVDGEMRAASDSLVQMVAPFGRMLDPDAEQALVDNDEAAASREVSIGHRTVLIGYRALPIAGGGRAVLAAPARADELLLGRRRRDLGILVLFATALGAIAAFYSSELAARQLAKPIRNLREAALSIAGGERIPSLEPEPTSEFQPVFTAFRQMASDLHASRSALEEAQRRTAAVLRNVASGVVALGPEGQIDLANPRAQVLLGRALNAGESLVDVAAPLAPLVERGSDDEPVEMEINGRQLQGRRTELARGGSVITLDDVTDVARAQRVIAWGEMARQIAHEIKNPLTPIRLGIQHLTRARADKRVNFDRVLEENAGRILAEIDRLDEIARAFSRYGAPPAERATPEPMDVRAVAHDVIGLERMGAGDGVEWRIGGDAGPAIALGRRDELKEVLLNLFENSRHARARHVQLSVETNAEHVQLVVIDDGEGIPAEVLPRVFEPHFSTRTSGSGLGLAISRQIIDSWGGSISVSSAPGQGTRVTIQLRKPED